MADVSELLNNLSAEQRAAATLLWQKPVNALQVVAGAGSGKTTTLVASVLSAVKSGFAPEKIAVITFSRRAAGELRERLAHYAARPGYCGTIHALAWQIIRQGGLTPKLVLNSGRLRRDLSRKILPHYAHIPDSVLLRRGFLNETEQALLGKHYDDHLSAHNLIDFDSMVPVATALGSGSDRFDVIFVDEFQDTSPDQAAFILSLKPQKLFVVGDDWQSIYAFRGADVGLTRDFQKLVPGAVRQMLLSNYRSQKKIVRLGNRAIRLSQSFVRKKLRSTRRAAATPVCYLTETGDMKEAWRRFHSLAAGTNELPEKITVLVRTNSQRLLLEKELPAGFEVMTIHKSKGLEFDNVLVFGIASHSMPHRENDFDEEVRLLYVALTRARSFLGFVAWEKAQERSAFLPFLLRHCRLRYY